jgi:hypothetical protein
VEEVAHVLSRKGPREHALIERFLGEPSHRALLEAWVHTLVSVVCRSSVACVCMSLACAVGLSGGRGCGCQAEP